jgi:hypothetical protein
MYKEIAQTLWAEAEYPVAVVVNAPWIFDEIKDVLGGHPVMIDEDQEEFVSVMEADEFVPDRLAEDVFGDEVIVVIEDGIFYLGANFGESEKWIGVPLEQVTHIISVFLLSQATGGEDAETE